MRAVVLITALAACSYSPTRSVVQGDDIPPVDMPLPIDTAVDIPPPIDACVATTEVCNGGTDEDCNEMTDCGDPACGGTAYCCSGTGKIFSIPNNCNDDHGTTGSSDQVEVYCCDGQTRFCLSGEACPWRVGCIASAKTCSHAGLSDDILAIATCNKFMGITTYGCSPDEQAILTP